MTMNEKKCIYAIFIIIIVTILLALPYNIKNRLLNI